MRKLAVSILALAFSIYAFKLSSTCVTYLVNFAVRKTVNDFLSAYDIFRIHEIRACNMKVDYALDSINLKEREIHFTFNFGVIKHNLYYLECTVTEGVKWTYICNLMVKPELSPNYAIMETFKGETINPIPKVEERTFKIYEPCPKYMKMYERLSFSGALKVFPIVPPSDPLGKFIVTYINNEFISLLEHMSICDDKVETIAQSLYYHIDLLSKLGIIHGNIDEIKEALVPCWTQAQCFLRDIAIKIAMFYGIKVNVLGEVDDIDVNTMVTRVILTIAVLIISVKVIRKIVRNRMVNKFIEAFMA